MGDELGTNVELSIACRNLAKKDAHSKSDRVVVVFEFRTALKDWKEIWQSETIQNNLNPNFSKKCVLQYHFEEQQKLKFEVYDVDNSRLGLTFHKFMGCCYTTLGEIVSAGELEKNIIDGPAGNVGVIILTAEKAVTCNDEITLHISAKKVHKKNIFGLPNPFLTFYRMHENGSAVVVHRTEVIKNTLSPIWNTIVLPVRLLCNGDFNRMIGIQCMDWNQSGGESLIGETHVTVNQLLQMSDAKPIALPLIHSEKARKKKNYENSGVLLINDIFIEEDFSFIDYVQGGTELCCCIAIDFTASNGHPQVAGTLHYCTQDQLSKYAVALQAVGEIISDYDSDNLFPAYGFGARIPPDNVVSHNFPLNGHPEDPFCQGIDGVMEAYRYALQTVTLHGPTNFAPIINQVANLAQQIDDGSRYCILLILTDGIICDMSQTKAAVVNASRLPVSIIIVGIGSADFSDMVELDGDEIRLTSKGQPVDRDIVQFVPFDDFADVNSVTDTKRKLAKAVLAEIPDQLISYMRSKGYKPPNIRHKHSLMLRHSKTAPDEDYCNPQSSSPSAPAFPCI